MNCPREETLLRALVGELTVNEAAALARHRERCPRCHGLGAQHELLLADLRAPPVLARSEDAFVASVVAACQDMPRPRELALPALWRRRSLLWSGALAVAAAIALASLAVRRTDHPTSAPAGGPAHEYFAARGASDGREPLAFADLLFVRAGVAARLSGAALQSGDALAVRCTNRGDQRAYLAVFALDASDATHWIFPAYNDESLDPSSIAIEPALRDRLLDEVVEPASPASGPLRVYAVWSEAPLTVHAIEAHLDELSASAPDAFFSRAYIQRWSATWNAP
jgi:anti-sigma factor RsiW